MDQADDLIIVTQDEYKKIFNRILNSNLMVKFVLMLMLCQQHMKIFLQVTLAETQDRMAFMSPIYYSHRGTYYGKGQVRMYNGNGYNTYTATQSPYVQGYSALNLADVYNINENQQIYGSEIFLNQFGIQPDLIEAIGDNDCCGYVKATDLEDDVPDTLDEAIEYQKSLPKQRQIPLYQNDGETVIGTYTIYY